MAANPGGRTVIMLQGDKPVPRLPVPAGAVELPVPPAGHYAVWRNRIYFHSEDGRSPAALGIEVSDLEAGIYVFRAEHVVIRNVITRGYRYDGIQVRGPIVGKKPNPVRRAIPGLVLDNVTSQSNGRAGVALVNSVHALGFKITTEDNQKAGLLLERNIKIELVEPAFKSGPTTLQYDGSCKVRQTKLPPAEPAP